MRSVTKSISPIVGVFLTAVAIGAARADPTPMPPAATAAPSSPTTVAPVSVAANPEDKVVCRTEIPTGTRFSHRVCMRKSDWDLQTQDARHKRDFGPPMTTSGGH